MATVGISELRQNLSRYIQEVKEGASFLVTERGREVARLLPSGPADSPFARLTAERGAGMPHSDLLSVDAPGGKPAVGPPSERLLDELRGDRR